MNTRSLIRGIVPASWWQPLRNLVRKQKGLRRLSANYAYDQARFLNYSSPFRKLTSEEQLRSYVTMLAHGIEKGLALPNPRPGFGSDKVQSLVDNLGAYLARYGSDPLIGASLSALEAYLLFNQQNGLDMIELAARIRVLRTAYWGASNACPEETGGGTREVLATEIHAASRIDLTRFFEYRFSVRQFSEQPVDVAQISDAIQMAQKTPSVCNRQSGRVHVFENDDLGKKALACQTGNRGFGDRADKILVVTSELGSFLSVGERNQCWIDGGMFAMSLIYALHSKGLGTCCLNWSVEKEADQQIRRVADIARSENIIMLIAVGHLPYRFRVACSPRKPLNQIATFHCCEGITSSTLVAASKIAGPFPMMDDNSLPSPSDNLTMRDRNGSRSNNGRLV